MPETDGRKTGGMNNSAIQREKDGAAHPADDLKSTIDRFRIAFQTSPDAISINRLFDGLYVEVNEGFCAMTGYNRDEVLGKTTRDIRIWVDPELLRSTIHELVQSGLVRNVEGQFRLKDGVTGPGLSSPPG